PQSAWDFAKFSVKFAGATPPTNPPTDPTDPPTDPGTGQCTAGAWSASAVYVKGDKVTQDGHTWEAKWWTTNEKPG
ncbi:chitinase, partial [Streptomyces sp. SID11233]|nr:chitinase [Streptomyces sp. SID11233]